ncbi:putative beta-lactamase [Nocardia nova SH22a]|uniref:Putative beta-lactamase n=1 Tax=Nocardia nova SH22a TaxID=1415166 RepID=W5TD18_9NOCA|nr:serine hydrolase [Nocardia nova]AHH15131.1 putative beta-lactamase [Nocardia nova SH22a]
MGRLRGWVIGVLVTVLISGVCAATAVAEPAEPSCAVTSGRDFATAAPESEGMDSARLASALNFAAERNRLNVKIFRNNCLIGSGPDNAATGGVPWNVWSVTKSVVSLIAGIAWDQGKLDIDAPIGRYLPPGLGDAAHRAITVRDLLTETSGLRVGVINEGVSGVIPIDPNSAVQALGVPFDNPPGTEFSYSQRNVDLLAYVVELAAGEPLQEFAQRELFTPLGIGRDDYYWARDRSGHTYGYAHLLIPPDDLAKLALLVSDDGQWDGQRVVSSDYLRQARQPGPTHTCYGFLFWARPGCIEMPSFLPSDVFAMSGMGLQNAFFIPSLGLTVVWTGVFGNRSSGGPTGILQNPTELTWEFFRRLLAAFDRPPIPDPGPYVEPPVTLDPRTYFDPNITLALFGVGPDTYHGCNVLSCLNIPLAQPFSDAPPGCLVLVCLGPDPRTPGIH